MDDQSSAEILVERNDGWATVVLNRPQRRNALTRPLLDQLATAIDQLSADESIAAIVLRGAEGAFSSGIDLTDLSIYDLVLDSTTRSPELLVTDIVTAAETTMSGRVARLVAAISDTSRET